MKLGTERTPNPRKRLTPYQKIRNAIARGSISITLTYDDLAILGLDTAILDRASNDDEYASALARESLLRRMGHG